MIDQALELENQFELLLAVLVPAGAVLLGFYVLGRHALPVRLALAIFGAGSALLAFLTYRRYQSLVD